MAKRIVVFLVLAVLAYFFIPPPWAWGPTLYTVPPPRIPDSLAMARHPEASEVRAASYYEVRGGPAARLCKVSRRLDETDFAALVDALVLDGQVGLGGWNQGLEIKSRWVERTGNRLRLVDQGVLTVYDCLSPRASIHQVGLGFEYDSEAGTLDFHAWEGPAPVWQARVRAQGASWTGAAGSGRGTGS